MTYYIKHENYKGGINNLTVIEAFNPIVNRIPFIAMSTKGEKQALINLKRQVKTFLKLEDIHIGGFECVNKKYMQYRVNKLYNALINKQ